MKDWTTHMERFVFVQDMPDVKITLTAGPSYFGMLSIARETSRTLISAALQQHPDKLVIENKNDREQEEGIRLDIDYVGNNEVARQLEAAIHQTMMLQPNVTIKVVFTENDVMLPDVSEFLADAVIDTQKGLREWTNATADSISMWY
ncbi:MAG: hypothetical protein ACO1N2_00605 [Candidatus Saccharimonadota bacterium]